MQQSCEKEDPARTVQIQGIGRYKILKNFLIICTRSDLTGMAYCGYPVKKKNPLIIFHNLFILGVYFLSKEGKGIKEL